MTVILGINLSDRVYIAGDSRISDLITDRNGNETVVPKSDNIQKVDLVSGDSGVALACAGDAKFAAKLLQALYKEDFSKRGISSIRNNIEDWAKTKADDYFTRYSYTSATFIFAGSDSSKSKKVSAKKVLSLATTYLREGMQGKMKSHLAQALELHVDNNGGVTNGEMELGINDTVMFSVKISPSGVEITDTEFGQFLLYGPAGLVKEDLDESYIGSLEYSLEGGDIRQDIGLTIVLLQELAATKQLDSVGGCVIPICAHEDGSAYFIDGTVERLDRNTGKTETINAFYRRHESFYRVDENGSWRKMIRVADYRGEGSGRLRI